jgi:hypothetical protein
LGMDMAFCSTSHQLSQLYCQPRISKSWFIREFPIVSDFIWGFFIPKTFSIESVGILRVIGI